MYPNNINSTSLRAISLILLLISMVFPIISLIISMLILITNVRIDEFTFVILKFMCSLGMGVLAFYFVRLDFTGDVYQYEISFNYLCDRLSNGTNQYELYDYMYYSWTYIQYLIANYIGDFRWVNFICVFLFTYSGLSLVQLVAEYYNSMSVRRILVIKHLLFFSIVVIFTSYKNTLAFSLVSYGLLIMSFKPQKKIFAIIIVIIGLGFHFSAFLLVFIYMLKNKYKISFTKLLSALLVGIIFKSVISTVLSKIPNIPFLTDKVLFYTQGEWASYRFHDRGEYIVFYQIFFVALLIISSFYHLKRIKNLSLSESKYVNFAELYFFMTLLLISFRTFSLRFLWNGLFLLYPVFAIIILRYPKLKFYSNWTILFLLTFDLRNLFMPFYDSFKIANGFPVNLFINTWDLFQ